MARSGLMYTWLAVVLALFSVAASPASAQEIELSGPLARSSPRGIRGFASWVDGRHVLVWGDLETDELFELFLVDVSGLTEPRVLNGPLAPGGDVGGGAPGADFDGVIAFHALADRIVYAADQEQDGRIELFSTKSSGGSTVKLNGTLVGGGDVAVGLTQRPFQITPDGERVLYLADQDADDVFELYGVPLDGGSAPVRLSAPLVASGDVVDFRISPDSQRVVYRADRSADGRFELFGASTDGTGPSSRVGLALPAGGDVPGWGAYEISSDSRFAVFGGDLRVDERYELFSAPLVGSRVQTPLSGQLVIGGDVLRFSIAPDASSVVYLADQFVDEKAELLATPLGRSGPLAVLNGPLTASRDVTDFAIAPHGGRVVYLADEIGNDVFELFSARLDDSLPPVRLNAPLSGSRNIAELVGVTSDGTRVLYRGDEREDEVFGLFSAPVLGDAPSIELSAPLVTGGDVVAGSAVLGPDGSRVVYRADREVDGVPELYSAPTDGSSPAVKVNLPLGRRREIQPGFALTAGGAHVLYLADHERNGQHELHAASIDGSEPAHQLTHTLAGPIVGDVLSAVISPDGSRAVYVADQEEDQLFDLYGVPTDGSEDPIRLTPALMAGGGVGLGGDGPIGWIPMQISPDGARVVYYARQDSSRVELFSVPADGSGAAVKLNGPLVDGGRVGPTTPGPSSHFFAISPDSSRVVYAASQLSTSRTDLFGVSIDGHSPAVRLNGAAAIGSVLAFAISPDGSRVVYVAGETRATVLELFSVPVDGSGAPVRLHEPFPIFGDVLRVFQSSLVFTTDGSRVLYVADANQDEVFELFIAPTDGSAAPIQLSAGAVGWRPGGALSDSVQVSSDGRRVLFSASGGLFSRAIDGSTPPLLLHPPLVPRQLLIGGLKGFRTCSSVPIVLFELPSPDPGGLNRLYSAPDDGSAAPVELSRELPEFPSTFFPFFLLLDSEGTRAVFFARRPEVFELHSVPVDGSSHSVRLSSPSSSPGNNAVVSPDGRRVLYVQDVLQPYDSDLFVAPIDGSSASRRVNSTLLPGRSVGLFFQAPVGDLVLYTADRDEDDVFELFGNSSALAVPAIRAR